MKPKIVMRLKPRNGGPEEIIEIGGIDHEEQHGYQVRGLDGKRLGYFGADQYENIIFEIWWPKPPSTSA
jgi:hypothetical protein